MLGSTIPVSIIGNRYSMVVEPFWKPNQYSKYIYTVYRPSFFTLDSTHRGHALWERYLRYRGGSELRAQRDRVGYSSSVVLYHSDPSYSENRDKIEVYLAFGASRFEASKQIATEALRLALTPMINQMRYVYPDFRVPGLLLTSATPTQRNRHHMHSRDDDWCNPRGLLRPASRTPPNHHHVHDILRHCAILDPEHHFRPRLCHRR